MTTTGRRVLVTGLGGFIGRHCVPPLLARGFEIVGLGRGARPDWLPPDITWHAIDLFDPAAVRAVVANARPSHALNLAWYLAHGTNWRSPDGLTWVRSGLTLIEAFAEAGGTRFVGAGTCAEYDWNHGFLSEAVTPMAPRTPFGHFKAALREASQAFAETAGISFAWGRVFFVYGPHEKPPRLAAYVIDQVLRGARVKTTHGRQIRDYSHVADIAGGFVALLDSAVTGSVNLGSGTATSVRDVIDAITAVTGGGGLVEFGALPLAAGEPPFLVADTRLLRQEIGFVPRFDLKDGARDTVEAFRADQRGTRQPVPRA